MLGNKHALSACYVCEMMHAMSIRLTLLAVHTLNTINNKLHIVYWLTLC